ncbi:Exonuclease VapC9 [Metallosphaera sp. J1]|uniref:type II toxin-antitoxin system VapC family toxin n=1 Tax=Metallosphaera javensis (ex Hofmann et al. 2022) TaxID=99938 RepID=UPI001EE0D92F|nr:type II toxin-antitoxin system VapC family toxin [Metallosphaera javensis (ex Hofmann et al. 2022)]MCG3109825.1 Exonuclease VapC9 [Metallosphaera javensis (ex Hofmann et al. 2022)]
MSYIFDSSSIYRAILERKVNLLGGNYTAHLARSELGNIVWKEVNLRKRLSREEGIRLTEFVEKVLDTMIITEVNMVKIEMIAISNDITYYDATFVSLASELNFPLVTEDERLRRKVENRGIVDVISLDELGE